MIEIKNILSEDLKSAIKGGDKRKSETIKSIINAITISEKSEGKEKSDLMVVFSRLKSARKTSIDAYAQANREDLADNEREELSIIESYGERFLPKQMTDEEILGSIKEIFSLPEFASIQNQNAKTGRLMGEFMKRHKGLAEPSRVISLANSQL